VVIDSSLLASMDVIDSRLVDMANYGELIIKNNMWYKSRKKTHILPLSYFPQIDKIKNLRLIIDTNGISVNGLGRYKNLF
jgi:hypothetical protein